jgi:predicted RNA binding protein YcfA (HicA-like mRNA interferase family)
VSNAAKLLDKMRRNPRDWRIEDLRVVAASLGLIVQQGKGSHVKFSHSHISMQIVVPARRPIREVYVRRFVRLIDEIAEAP